MYSKIVGTFSEFTEAEFSGLLHADEKTCWNLPNNSVKGQIHFPSSQWNTEHQLEAFEE